MAEGGPTQPPAPPQVSVILPVRNRARLVEDAMRSVLRQTWRDLELLVADGGSTDGTVEVLRRVAAEDPRVVLLLHGAREGVSAARNAAARRARGRWLAFQDSDDAWHPEKLERQMAALARLPGARMAYTGIRRHLRGRTVLRPPEGAGWPEGDLHARLLRKPSMNTPTLVVERALFHEAGGFDEALQYHEDWDLAVRCSARTPVACAPGWLVESPQGDDSLSRDAESHMAARRRMLATHDAFLRRHPAVRQYRHADLGWRMLGRSEPGAWRQMAHAVACRPWSLHGEVVRAGWDVWRRRV